MVTPTVRCDDLPAILDPGSAAGAAAVATARRELAEVGCTVLRGFVPAEQRARLQTECASVAELAWTGRSSVNVYNTDPDASLPAGHPGRVRFERENAFVPRDRIPGRFLIQRLYGSQRFAQFLAACFGLPAVHRLADPLSGLTLNVVAPGRSHPWHFDANELTVSLLTQSCDTGGLFEYCPGIRRPADENLPAVAAVLAGTGRDLVRQLALQPGDLQLFRGRYALHRVTTVGGAVPRHTAIFAYSRTPGVVGSRTRARQLFGRADAAHRAGRSPADGLLD